MERARDGKRTEREGKERKRKGRREGVGCNLGGGEFASLVFRGIDAPALG